MTLFHVARLLFLLAQLGQDAVVFQRRRVARRLSAAGDVAQQPAHDLAGARLGQRVGEADLVGPGQGADLLGDVLAAAPSSAPRSAASPPIEGHEAGDALALDLVGLADDGGLGDLGVMRPGRSRLPWC